VRVMHDRVAAIDVHKDMVKVAVRVPGARRGTRKTDVLEFRTFYGVLEEMGRELRRRGVTHVVMEASGVYTDPVYYALAGLGFTEVMVINPAHAKALKGHKTDAKDAIRLLDLYECGLLSGSYIPPAELKEVRDLARYRMKTVQARTCEIQRLQKTLESAGIKLCSVVSEVTGASATAMIEALIDGERRGAVLAELAQGRMRSRQKMAGLPMALAGRFTAHHALMCRLHLDRIKVFDEAVAGLDATIAPLVARYSQEAELLKTLPGFGDVVVAGWLGAIGPAPHEYFATAGRLASWTTVCPGNYMSAKKSKGGQTGDGGAYIKPLLVQAAWAATRVPGRLQAKFRRLVRKFGGPKNKRAIMAIAHTLLKIAYQVLKTGTPYHDLGADFYASRESPQARQDYLIRQLHKLNPGCIITITPPPGGRLTASPSRSPSHRRQEITSTEPGRRPTRTPGRPSPHARAGCRAPRNHPTSCQ
jgi:transposase